MRERDSAGVSLAIHRERGGGSTTSRLCSLSRFLSRLVCVRGAVSEAMGTRARLLRLRVGLCASPVAAGHNAPGRALAPP